VNTKWSAGATVLAGDWLFARAARFAADTESVPVLKIFARTLGALTDGELRQLFGRTGVPTLEEYEFRIYSKTASLFEAAAEATGELMELDGPAVTALATFGRELGNAFQIADDILDFVADERELGKPVGSDLRSGTVTLPAMLYLRAHPEAAPWLAANDGQPDEEAVSALIEAVRGDVGTLDEARAAAARRRDLAVDALSAFAPSQARADLERIAAYAVDRSF
jgi:geranylgeranyl pyrophosphate synthase